MSVLHMHHAEDPRAILQSQLGDVSHVQLMHNQILVATYVRPERTSGGIILTHGVRKEDEYQGKIGMVIAKGPLAFVDDHVNNFAGQNVEIGDWVAYRQSDGWQVVLKGERNAEHSDGTYHCRMLQDIDIKAKVTSPDDMM